MNQMYLILNSATAPRTVNTIFPVGVDVSIRSDSLTNSMPSVPKVCKTLRRVGYGPSEAIEPPDDQLVGVWAL
jgi:hypothetical protein